MAKAPKDEKMDVRFEIVGRGKKAGKVFRLSCDSRQFILEEVQVSQSGDSKGQERFVHASFHVDVGSVATRMFREGLSDSVVRDLKELQEAYSALRDQIATQFAVVDLV